MIGYLYLCADWKNKLLKIGYSSKPEMRVKELRWEYQKDFRLIHKIKCEQQIEFDLHMLLEDHRARINSAKSATISKEIYHLDSYAVQKVVEFFTRMPIRKDIYVDNEDINLSCRNCGKLIDVDALSVTSFIGLIKLFRQVYCSEDCKMERSRKNRWAKKVNNNEIMIDDIVKECVICKEILSNDRAKILVTCSTKCEIKYRNKKKWAEAKDTIPKPDKRAWEI